MITKRASGLKRLSRAFNEKQHIRYPKGDPRGGQFAPKEGGVSDKLEKLLAKPTKRKLQSQLPDLVDEAVASKNKRLIEKIGSAIYKLSESGHLASDEEQFYIDMIHEGLEKGKSFGIARVETGIRETKQLFLSKKKNAVKPPENSDSENKLQNFKSIEEAQAWAEANYPNIKWDLSGLHPSIAAKSLQTFDSLAKDYPFAAKSLIGFEVTNELNDADDGAMGAIQGSSSTGFRLVLDSNHFGNPEEFNRRIKEDRKKGWAPQNNEDAWTEVITHEFGHLLDSVITSATLMGDTEGYEVPHPLADSVDFFKDSKSRTDQLSYWRGLWGKNYEGRGADTSIYGRTNSSEEFAENFVALRFGDRKKLSPDSLAYVTTMENLINLASNYSSQIEAEQKGYRTEGRSYLQKVRQALKDKPARSIENLGGVDDPKIKEIIANLGITRY